MPTTVSTELTRIHELEIRLQNDVEDVDKLRTIHELADFYTFTNIREAKKLLNEQSILLQKYQNTEGVLRFHLNTAIVENQFYNFKQSDKHFRLALKIVEDEGNATQQAEVYIDYAGTLMNLGEKEQALDCIEKAHRHLASFPDEVLYARLICREGYLLWLFSDYDKATELFFQSDKIFSNIEPKPSLV